MNRVTKRYIDKARAVYKQCRNIKIYDELKMMKMMNIFQSAYHNHKVDMVAYRKIVKEIKKEYENG